MAKKKIIKKEIIKPAVDKKKVVELELKNSIQQINIYPKYNPLRK
jgi:hypothetical protein